ncbi:Predicted integral membrane protein [Mycobacteroides abscessus]|uniref:SdpI/YhfL family protein n=3 Tax=Mycobacteroides abscessus TaxID=36809 RepID=A0A829I2E3_9MYCO|nr:sdpI/YhfL family protein [Mycobacteroides abscessus subsp. massiliense str. GO 06]AMU24038.1 sdpI/YhfL family protein [Mycobacteroides abscessus]EHB97100.1 hypothetical protein MAB47J26_21805 [Mycobacteroides abscessus 47J26]EPQ25605.1 sdpI/YhfL family protein [Mycobacteroides abscessus subsp. bolletii CRM-0020]QCO28904.1 sdpI/YhfL family protein [Mycobacteroides abscessus subsp. massiliense]SIK74614.1 Predicted integral membrane protein [Mycobacteroides abscessus subsp. abscessus]
MRQNNAVGDGRGPTLSRMVVAGCFLILSVVVVVLIIRGYYLAMNDQLPSNLTFGFRSPSTLSSESAWYASQRTGFSWLLFGVCPVLVIGSILTLVSIGFRKSFIELVGISTASWLLVVGIGVIAHIQAENAAEKASSASAQPLTAK